MNIVVAEDYKKKFPLFYQTESRYYSTDEYKEPSLTMEFLEDLVKGVWTINDNFNFNQ